MRFRPGDVAQDRLRAGLAVEGDRRDAQLDVEGRAVGPQADGLVQFRARAARDPVLHDLLDLLARAGGEEDRDRHADQRPLRSRTCRRTRGWRRRPCRRSRPTPPPASARAASCSAGRGRTAARSGGAAIVRRQARPAPVTAAKRAAAASTIQTACGYRPRRTASRSTSTTTAQPISGIRRAAASTRCPRPSEYSPEARGRRERRRREGRRIRGRKAIRGVRIASAARGATTRKRSPSRTTTKSRSLSGPVGLREEGAHRVRGVDGEQHRPRRPARRVRDGLGDLEVKRVVAGVDRVGEDLASLGDGPSRRSDVGLVEGRRRGRGRAQAARRIEDADRETAFLGRTVRPDRAGHGPRAPESWRLREERPHALEPGEPAGLAAATSGRPARR